jgi:hypothetical protein
MVCSAGVAESTRSATRVTDEDGVEDDRPDARVAPEVDARAAEGFGRFGGRARANCSDGWLGAMGLDVVTTTPEDGRGWRVHGWS